MELFYLPNYWNVIIFIFHYEEGHSELHSNNLDVKQGYAYLHGKQLI